MRHRGTVVWVILAAIGPTWTCGRAQETRKADEGDAGGPKLVPAKTEGGTGGTGSEEGKTAETTKETTKEPVPVRKQSDSIFGQWGFMIILFGGMLLLLFWSSRSRRKQESKHKQMLASLNKGDKVVTIGGIVGTVIEVRPEEITVKVDESNNVRMKFVRSAIRSVGEQARKGGEPAK
jgi:preprotein translocase subunit YajC